MIEYFTYQEISKNKKLGRNINQTAKFLNLDRKTVAKYWDVSNSEFIKMSTQEKSRKRKSKCDGLKPRIVEMIKDVNEISTSAIYDRLAESSESKLDFTERTLNNYVRRIRKELGIPKQTPLRDHQATEELPPGRQAQVDFGECHLRRASNPKKRKKIYFFIMVLRFSRYKYVEFQTPNLLPRWPLRPISMPLNILVGFPMKLSMIRIGFLLFQRMKEIL